MIALSSSTLLHHRRCLLPSSIDDINSTWSFIDIKDPRVTLCWRNTKQRHDLKKLSSSFTTSVGDHSELVKLMTYLDRSGIALNLDRCWEEYARPLSCPAGVDFLCRWAVTSLRHGIHRVFFASRLISLIATSGISVQTAILTFLNELEQGPAVTTDVHALISELVRCRLFSVPDYLRWLIASGRLARYRSPASVITSSCLRSCIIHANSTSRHLRS